jgi:hypothetical protein
MDVSESEMRNVVSIRRRIDLVEAKREREKERGYELSKWRRVRQKVECRTPKYGQLCGLSIPVLFFRCVRRMESSRENPLPRSEIAPHFAVNGLNGSRSGVREGDEEDLDNTQYWISNHDKIHDKSTSPHFTPPKSPNPNPSLLASFCPSSSPPISESQTHTHTHTHTHTSSCSFSFTGFLQIIPPAFGQTPSIGTLVVETKHSNGNGK